MLVVLIAHQGFVEAADSYEELASPAAEGDRVDEAFISYVTSWKRAPPQAYGEL